jgi:hypothetical protein
MQTTPYESSTSHPASRRAILGLSFFFIMSIQFALAASAIGPMEYYYGLVAGQGDKGYRNGFFSQALFQEPSGLALNPEETLLFVSDAGNHCVRAIDLAHQNTVSTLVGKTKAGHADGAFLQASFDNPRNLAMLPNRVLAVNDAGNGTIRLIDLASKSVTTWFSIEPNHTPGSPINPAIIIQDMVFSAANQTLYYSQPPLPRVMKIALGESKPTEAFPRRAELTRPGPLALLQDKLVVGNLNDGNIYNLESLQDALKPATPLTRVEKLNALVAVGPTLFALPQKGEMIVHPLENTTTFLPTSEGDATNVTTHPYFFRYPDSYHPQWVASKLTEKKFFITSANNPVGVFYFKDYNFTALKDKNYENSAGLKDFEYPRKKSPGTFRILMVGDSHTFEVMQTGSRSVPEYSRMLSIPKRLEWQLNSRAVLNGSNQKYEVLLSAHGSDEAFPIALWPYYLAPISAEQYDVDLVLMIAVPQLSQPGVNWCNSPITPEGIPALRLDYEYYQKPWAEKAPPGTERRRFLDRCLQKKLATIRSDGYNIDFSSPDLIHRDPDLVDDIVWMTGKPLGMLSKKISSLRTKAGTSMRFALCYVPLTTFSLEDYNRLWRGVAGRFNIPLIDLTSPVLALRESRIPGSDQGHEHFSPDGHDLIAQLITDALVKERWVPLAP